MKFKKVTIVGLALALGAAVLGTASTSQAGPKPGLVPGKWIVTGTLSGSGQDGVMSISNRGLVRLALNVAPDHSVTGSGTWKRTMTGAGADTKSVIIGTATLKLSGPSRDAKFAGKEYSQGKIWVNGHAVSIGTKGIGLAGTLVIARAGDCTANGSAAIPTRPGLKLEWTAKRAINGTCNA